MCDDNRLLGTSPCELRELVLLSKWWWCAMLDRKSTRLNSSHMSESRIPSSAWKKKSLPTQLPGSMTRLNELSQGDFFHIWWPLSPVVCYLVGQMLQVGIVLACARNPLQIKRLVGDRQIWGPPVKKPKPMTQAERGFGRAYYIEIGSLPRKYDKTVCRSIDIVTKTSTQYVGLDVSRWNWSMWWQLLF